MHSEKRTIGRTITRATLRTAAAVAPSVAARAVERLFFRTARFPTPDRERVWLAGARREVLELADGRSLPVSVWGDGPPVLLVHGWWGRGSQLGAFAAPLAARGFRVITWDAPGHGEASGRSSSLPAFVDLLLDVAEAVGPIEGIVAHSFGAAVTTVALGRGLTANRLVYLAPPENPGRFLDGLVTYLGLSDGIARRARRRIADRFDIEWEALRGLALAPSIRTSLLVIHDLEDAEVPWREGAALVAVWPDSTMITTRGLGHRRLLRDPATVEAAAAFLAEPALSEGPTEAQWRAVELRAAA